MKRTVQTVRITREELEQALALHIGVLQGHLFFPYRVIRMSWDLAQGVEVQARPSSVWNYPGMGPKQDYFEEATFTVTADDILTAIWKVLFHKNCGPSLKPTQEDVNVKIPEEVELVLQRVPIS